MAAKSCGALALSAVVAFGLSLGETDAQEKAPKPKPNTCEMLKFSYDGSRAGIALAQAIISSDNNVNRAIREENRITQNLLIQLADIQLMTLHKCEIPTAPPSSNPEPLKSLECANELIRGTKDPQKCKFN